MFFIEISTPRTLCNYLCTGWLFLDGSCLNSIWKEEESHSKKELRNFPTQSPNGIRIKKLKSMSWFCSLFWTAKQCRPLENQYVSHLRNPMGATFSKLFQKQIENQGDYVTRWWIYNNCGEKILSLQKWMTDTNS